MRRMEPSGARSSWDTLETNWEMTACGVGALLIAVFGLHRFLLWIRKDKPWKWKWTISVTTLVMMLFAASIAMTGIIHQLGWMVREPLTQSGNRTLLTHNTSNAKQLFLLLAEYDHEHGALPKNLEILVSEDYIEAGFIELLMFHPERGRTPEPWIYLGAGEVLYEEHAEEGANEYPLLISPQPIRGKWVVLRRDGAVKQLRSSGVRREYPWLLERLPNLVGK